MSKKLLNEHTVRRFMKLAGTEVLASDFVKEGSVPASKNDLDGQPLTSQGGNDEFGSSKEYPGTIKKQPVTDLNLAQGSAPKGKTPVDKGGNKTLMEQPPEEEVLEEPGPEGPEGMDLPPGPEDELPPEGELPPEEGEGVSDVDLSAEEAEVLVSLGQKLAAELEGEGEEEELPPEEEIPADDLPPMGGEELPPMGDEEGPPMMEAHQRALVNQVLKETAQNVKYYLNALREQQQVTQLNEAREARKAVLAESLAERIFDRLKKKGGK